MKVRKGFMAAGVTAGAAGALAYTYLRFIRPRQLRRGAASEVKRYRLSPMKRLLNVLVKGLLAARLAPKHTYLLSVRGRKTGRVYSTPVYLVEEEGQRWLVAPYGEVNWVRNAGAAGEVTLTRNGRSETARIEELGPQESAPVLKEYLRQTRIVQPYFNARPDSPLEAFEAEAHRHYVFKVLQGAGVQQEEAGAGRA